MASFTRVSVDEMKFTPAHVEIVRGTSVRWEQSPRCMVRHCLEVVDPEENHQASSPALSPGEPWEHTFEACGDFHYRSLVYCFMKGTIKVVDAAPADVDATDAGAPVETRVIPLDATAAPAPAAASSSSRDEAPVPESLRASETELAVDDDVDDDDDAPLSIDPPSGSTPTRSIPPRFELPPVGSATRASSTANDRVSSASRSSAREEDIPHACDRCARAFVSSTNLKRHAATHGTRRVRGRFKNPKPPPASADELAAFFAGLSATKRGELMKSVAAPGSTGALVVCGIRARREEQEEEETHARRDGGATSPARAAYTAAGAALVKWVVATDATDAKTGLESSASLFDALSGASEGACFGPKVDVDLTTMCLDENLDAALAYCVEQSLFALYLEERSAEAEAARKLLLAEIDESRAEEERRAARRSEARARKAKTRAEKARGAGRTVSGSETDGAFSCPGTSVTVERARGERACAANAALRDDEEDTDRSGRSTSGPTSGAVLQNSRPIPSPRRADGPKVSRRAEVSGWILADASTSRLSERKTARGVSSQQTASPTSAPSADQAETSARRRGADFRGDSAKGGGATPAPLSAPRTGNERPTTAPPTPRPAPILAPNPHVTGGFAETEPSAGRAPRRAAPSSSPAASAAAKRASDVKGEDDAIVRPPFASDEAAEAEAPVAAMRLEPRGSRLANAPRKSRRALKAERLRQSSARVASGDASASATEAESASGSDFGYSTGQSDFLESTTSRASRVAEGAVRTSTRRARAAARAAEKTNADPTKPRRRSSADDPEDSFASPAGTPPATKPCSATPAATFASPPSAARAIPVAQVWTPEREFARMAMRPLAFEPPMAMGAAGAPGSVPLVAPLGAPPAGMPGTPLHLHRATHQLHHPPPGIDPNVYMHHYATALAAIQASQAGVAAARSGPSPMAGPNAPFAPPLPPGPPPQASRASR